MSTWDDFLSSISLGWYNPQGPTQSPLNNVVSGVNDFFTGAGDTPRGPVDVSAIPGAQNIRPQGNVGPTTASNPPAGATPTETTSAAVTALQGGQKLTTSQVLTLLQQNGADVTNPKVQTAAAGLALSTTDPNSLIISIQAVAGQYPVPVGIEVQGYHNATASYGSYAQVMQQTLPTHGGILSVPHSLDSVVNPDNGAVLYKNGVIADPNTSQVLYKPGSSAAGSPGWLHHASTTWGGDRIKEWRSTLADMGYLSKQQQGSGQWDVTFQNALGEYYNNKYLNQGTPLAKDTTANAAPITNLRTLHSEITSDVRAKYREVFGQDPSAQDLQSWTQFVIASGNKMQHQAAASPSGPVGPSAAVSEAEASAFNTFQSSPQGQYRYNSAQENTQLHDSILSAVGAVGQVS